MSNTAIEPFTVDELLAGAHAAKARYQHIRAIKEPWAREDAANEALLALVPAAIYHEASWLATTIVEAGRLTGEAYMEDRWRLVVRHFPSLEPALLAVFAHVQESVSEDDCSCPVGKRPAEARRET